jgi:hypothetical protein
LANAKAPAHAPNAPCLADGRVGGAVKRRRGVDAGVLRRGERERAAHAEADGADLRGGRAAGWGARRAVWLRP